MVAETQTYHGHMTIPEGRLSEPVGKWCWLASAASSGLEEADLDVGEIGEAGFGVGGDQ